MKTLGIVLATFAAMMAVVLLVMVVNLRVEQAELALEAQDVRASLDAHRGAVAALEADVGAVKATHSKNMPKLNAEMRELSRQYDGLEERVVSASEDAAVHAKAAVAEAKAASTQAAADVQKQLDELKQLWVRKIELLQAIPGDALAKGYSLNWDVSDEYLQFTSVGEGITQLQDPDALSFSGGFLRTPGPAAALSLPLMANNDLSIEVLCRPDNLKQGGPARIVSISRDPGARSFTVGQDSTRYLVRFRTTKTNEHGERPHVITSSDTVKVQPQSVVFVRSGTTHHLYVDGALAASQEVPGDMSVWDHSMPLVIANEATGDRTWKGQIHGVTFFNRALTEEEVAERWAAARARIGAAQ